MTGKRAQVEDSPSKCVPQVLMKKQRVDKTTKPKPSSCVRVSQVVEIHGAMFTLEKQIGQGTFSCCFRAKTAGSSTVYAVKVQSLVDASERAKQRYHNEVRIHRVASVHPHIVKFVSSQCDLRNMYIQLELCPQGDLNSYVKNRRGINTPIATIFMRQITHAVAFLHNHGIIHRDIKLANIFLDNRMYAKIGDFGLATTLPRGESTKIGRVGTPAYMAPELFAPPFIASVASDVWALGIVMYGLVHGFLPFEGETSDEVKKQVLYGRWQFHSQLQSSGYRAIIRGILVRDYTSRPSAKALYEDLSTLHLEHKAAAPGPACSPKKKTKAQAIPKVRI